MKGQMAVVACAANVTSQNGEDGILRAIFDDLGIETGWCVEFGAWDGVLNSNTCTLWRDHGWNAVLIEGNVERAGELALLRSPRVTTISSYVAVEGDRSLDSILRSTPCPADVDLLSIDVDGDDFHIWESLADYQPKVVVIEYNRSLPPWFDWVQPIGDFTGSSGVALERLGAAKGYRLVAVTLTNLVFIHTSCATRFPTVRFENEADRDEMTVAVCDMEGHHFILRPGAWGYAAASRERTLRAVWTEGARATRRLLRERWPRLVKLLRRIVPR